MQTNACVSLRSSLSSLLIWMTLSPANAVVDVVPNASSEVLPANAVEDVVPKVIPVLSVLAVIAFTCASLIVVVFPANAVEDDVPKASTVFAVLAVIALV